MLTSFVTHETAGYIVQGSHSLQNAVMLHRTCVLRFPLTTVRYHPLAFRVGAGIDTDGNVLSLMACVSYRSMSN